MMELIIEITTIEFKSTEDNFYKEMLGSKRNTVRVIQGHELKDIEQYRNTIKYIRIKCTDGVHSFTRRLTDITKIKMDETVFYIFSW